MKRAMCVYFPHWPLQRLLRDRPTLRDRAAAVVQPHASRGARVRHCSRRALELGVRPGMPVAEANAVAPHVHLEEEDPRRDREALTSLAVWAERYSPLVGLEEAPEPECLFLDVTGCARCFHGEDNLLGRVRREFRGEGWWVRPAIADTPGAAWALAHFMDDPVAAPAGETRQHLSPLPVAGLRLTEETHELLDQLGIRTIGQLLELPRRDLAIRFHMELLRRLDQALGKTAEVIQPHPLQPEIEASLSFEYPIDHLPTLRVVLERLAVQVETMLCRRHVGARQVECRLLVPPPSPLTGEDRGEGAMSPSPLMGEGRGEGSTSPSPLMGEGRGEGSTSPSPLMGEGRGEGLRFEIGLFRPTQSAVHLCKMLTGRLEQARLEAPACGMRLRVLSAEPIPENQGDLLEPTADWESLSRLLDQLSNSLGRGEVLRAELAADYQPEHACRFEPVVTLRRTGFQPVRHTPVREERPPLRPVKLWPRPVSVQVLGTLPGGSPAKFRWGNQDFKVVRCWGPERIETGWWRGPQVRRDYFVLATHRGSRFWMFRHPETGWHLHGAFD